MELITNDRLKIAIKILRACLFIGLIGCALVTVGILGVLSYAKTQGAPPLAVPLSTLFYAEDGTLIGEERHHGETRYWVSLDDMSEAVIDATVSIEDRNFFDHNGFDYKRIGGAVLADIKAMAKVQGASTITQQYARNLFLEHEKTWNRKLTEALYTIRLEQNYSKEEILEGYLNTIYYGHGVYGIEAAANYYFGKRASELSLAEASMLAGIPKGPTHYSPLVNEEKAKQRQNVVLHSMVENGVISKKTAEQALTEKLIFTGSKVVGREDIAPYFQDVVKKELHSKLKLDQDMIETGGLRVYTTLDPDLQEIAEEKVVNFVKEDSGIQLGFVAMDPKNGEVRALIGGRDYEESPFNRAIQAKRQPGSTFKPILYYAALEKGYTPSTQIRSELTTFSYDDDRSTYTPRNYKNYYANDSITLAQAIALSDNVYAVKTHLFLGDGELVDTAKKVGIKSKLKDVPSLALGTSGVSVLEMVNAYATFDNGGTLHKPIFITRVENYKGEVIYEKNLKPKKVLDEDLAFVTTQLMTGMFDEKLNDYTAVTGTTISDKLTRFYAGKSGSTETDSWMIGYSPQLVAGIWTGYDNNEPLTIVEESQYAKNIWAGFMEEAHQDIAPKPFKPTEGVVGVYVNPDTGLLPTKDCPVSRLTYYKKGTEPTEYCSKNVEDVKKEKPKKKEEKEKKGFFKRMFDWF
ncbi:transglycosylase domain-containing protein [Fredinandcohnia sp. QZ13]|uniref:transglycosylase domain-containing protein n=1 Tax=Fredinandcohnia sp. QZ13 TaxID=3073144 RepID=UPI0028533B8F|nr:transglycosylase domain-containing protein [Fredinandcohnia sp. QZ13]MDR4890264.1 transglycosylase domain-containing protein [Fredinandcohnia sp. QZ13]